MRRIQVSVLVWLLSAVGCSRRPGDYIERGNQFFEKGKPADAVLQYRKAIQADSNSGEAYYRLGLAELLQGHAQEAYRALMQAVQLAPRNEEAVAKLADLDLAAYLGDPRRSRRFYGEVVRLAGQLLENNPNSVEGLRLKGAVALVDRKPREAIEYYEKAYRLKPQEFDVVEGLVQALFQENRFDEGERVARAFLELNKTAGSIYDVLHAHYLQVNRLDDAEKILRSKVDNNPREAEYRLQLARFYYNLNKPAQVTATLRYLLDHPKEFSHGHLQTGDFYNSIGNHEEALRQFQEGAQLNPKEQVDYQKRIVNTLLAEGKKEEAAKVLESILKAQPNDVEARTGRARLLLESGSRDNVVAAVAEFQALVKERPQDGVLRYDLGRAYLQNADSQAASVEFEESAKRSPGYLAPRLALAEVSMSRQKPQQTLRETEEILSLEPNQPRARFLHAVALSEVGRQSQAAGELAQLAHDFPQSPEAPMQLGVLAIRQRRFADAEQIFRKMRQEGQGDALASAGLAETYTAQKEFEKSIPLLQAELAKSPGSMVIGNLLAFTALRSGNYDLAIATYLKLAERSPMDVGVRWSLGQAYFIKGDYSQALAALEQARKLAPKDGRIEMLLAAALEKTGRGGEIKAHFERVLQLEPNNPAALNNMAFYLAENGGDLDEALRLAQKAVQASRNEPVFSDTLGWVYTKKKMYDPAVQIFNTLVEKQPSNPTFRYHLGVALLGKGSREQARITLQAALEQRPAADEDRKIKELLARLSYQ